MKQWTDQTTTTTLTTPSSTPFPRFVATQTSLFEHLRKVWKRREERRLN
jgi:hypothetical protein